MNMCVSVCQYIQCTVIMLSYQLYVLIAGRPVQGLLLPKNNEKHLFSFWIQFCYQ